LHIGLLRRLLALMLGLAAVPGAAQVIGGPFLDAAIPFDTDRGNNRGVLDRPRPELDPPGLRVGAFRLLPSVTIGAGYSSNVYATRREPVGDAFLAVAPNLAVRSNWARHQLSFDAGAAVRRYVRQARRDEDAFHADLRGRVDLGEGNIAVRARVQRAYEAPYSASFTDGTVDAVPFVTATGEVSGTVQATGLRATGFVDLNRIAFDNTRARSGMTIDQRARDRDEQRGGLRLEYAVTPDAAAFVQAMARRTLYRRARSADGANNRDAGEWRVLAGATFDLAALVRGSVGAGYVRRTYRSGSYPTLSGVVADARVSWFVTPLMTATVAVQRTAEDAVAPGAGGYLSTGGQARLDHELLRNLLLHAEAGWERNRFRGTDRRDDLRRVAGGATWSCNRRVVLTADMARTRRRSAGLAAGQSFAEVRALVGLTLRG